MRRIIGSLVGSVFLLALPVSASAHGGGPDSVVSFGAIVNWLHFVATALWLGGIVFLRLVVLPSLDANGARRGLMNAITVRFTHLVWWCVGGLALTGVLTTWIHVPSPETFTGTTYGLILVAKIAIAAGMVACNAVIGISLARRRQGGSAATAGVTASRSKLSLDRWAGPASRLSLILAFLMMVAISVLTEFDRSPWSIALNFLRLSSLTVWFGATAFVPLVLSPSLAGVDRAYLVRVNASVLRRFGRLATGCAIVALATTGLTIVKSVGGLSDLWETGYGTASLLEVAVLTSMAVSWWRSGFSSGLGFWRRGKAVMSVVPVATSKTMRRAIDVTATILVLGLGALLFSSISGALYSPEDSSLVRQIPTAAAIISLDWLEPLGYVVGAVVALAMIWYFGVVEGKIAKRDASEGSQEDPVRERNRLK